MDFYRILLVHGFFQSKKNMKYIQEFLIKEGYRVDSLDLPLTFKNIEVSEKIISNKIKEFIIDNKKVKSELVLIGFGIGGIILKKLIEKFKLENYFIKVILIATPSKKTILSKKYHGILSVISKIFKPLKIFLGNEIEEIKLPKDINIGIIRGTEANFKLFQKNLPEYNDGFYVASELLYDFETEVIDIPFGNNELLKRRGTVEYILDFIETGKFKPI